MVTEGYLDAVDGGRVPVRADTILLHGDNPAAVENARAVRIRPRRGGRRDRPAGPGARGAGALMSTALDISDCGDAAVRVTCRTPTASRRGTSCTR